MSSCSADYQISDGQGIPVPRSSSCSLGDTPVSRRVTRSMTRSQSVSDVPPTVPPSTSQVTAPRKKKLVRRDTRSVSDPIPSTSSDVPIATSTLDAVFVSPSNRPSGPSGSLICRDDEGFVVPPSPSLTIRTRRQHPSGSSVSSPRIDIGTSPVVHICPECARTFPTKIGLGQHRKSAHRLEYEADVNLARKKARWTNEEVRLLALKEAELVRAGSANINDLLHEFMPSRSFDAIKSKRRNRDYKDLVKEFLDSTPSASAGTLLAQSIRVVNCLSLEMVTPFQESLQHILNVSSVAYNEATLNNIWNTMSSLTPSRLLDEVTLFFRETFPDRPPRESRRLPGPRPTLISRRKLRQIRYKETQALYKKNRSRCINQILAPTSVSDSLSSEEMFLYWKNLMQETPGTVHDLIDYFEPLSTPAVIDVWEPITMEEIKAIRFSKNTAPGPDGFTAEDYDLVPKTVLCKLYNIFLVLGEVPTSLLRARTIFIPKKDGTSSPGDFRPISISSVFLRAYHKILARRLQSRLKLDTRQRGFISEDGCAQNVFMLDLVIKHQRDHLKDLFLASIDLHKAFDCVSHEAIFAAAASHGLPPQFVCYLKYLYQNSSTVLNFDSSTSGPFPPTRGVRQGDPLSPILFNIVLDRLFSDLPSAVGIDISHIRVNALAYADDLILVASSARGLQVLLDRLYGFLRRCGLIPNIVKSFTISLRASGKEKKIVTDASSKFHIDGRPLRSLTAVDTFRYLGVEFSPTGRTKLTKSNLADLLLLIRKAPLKPQQRLFALVHYILPKFSHQLTLGKIYIGFLRQLDMCVRMEVRRWLNLPHDTPVPYFYTSIADGGLGIPCFRWTIPLQKLRRLERVAEDYLTADNVYIVREIAFAKRFLQDGRSFIKNRSQVALFWRNQLYRSVDGSSLRDSSKVATQHKWVGDGTSFLSSKDYLNCIRLRINALPVRSRTTRGRRHLDRQCRGGCLEPETLNHVIQVCHRTHAARIARHDAILDYVQRKLTSRSHVVVREARFQTQDGVRKPDIIAVRNQEVFVLDVQVTGAANLNEANKVKVDKYKNCPGLRKKVEERFNSRNITYLALTISNRGVWAPNSAKELLDKQLIMKMDLKVLSTRAIIGGFAAFRIHGRMTSTRSDIRR